MCGCVLAAAVWSVLHYRHLSRSICHFGSGFYPSLAVFSIKLNHANMLTSCFVLLAEPLWKRCRFGVNFLSGPERHKSTERKVSDFNPAASNVQNIFDPRLVGGVNRCGCVGAPPTSKAPDSL